MNDEELGRKLLDLDAPADVRQQVGRILDRDRRRVRLLTGLAVGLWAVAAAMVFGMFVAMGLLMPKVALLAEEVKAGRVASAERDLREHDLSVTGHMILLGVAGSVGLLGLAALATVFLVLASRRATLRQINASLLEISEQLARLRPAGG